MTKRISRAAQDAKDLVKYKALDILTLSKAHRDAMNLGMNKYMASGVIVSVSDLSGNVILGPVMLADGMGAETIDALRKDIKRTYEGRLSANKI